MTLYYQDDFVTIYHGDCREIASWLQADVLITDPPYGMRYKSGGSRINADGARSETPRASIQHDQSTDVRDTALALWGNKPALVFGRWNIDRPARTVNRLIWHKRNLPPGLGGGTPWSPAEEEIYVLGKVGWVGARHQNVICTDEARAGSGGLAARTGHPTPKPVDLMRHLIERSSGIIADPFMGSGSTLLAAKHLGRKCIGVETDEGHCERAASRLTQEVLLL